jgi:hypothetical protein
MNKKSILLAGLTFVIAFSSCGPAAEEKSKMLSNAKRVADSIALIIKTSMDAAKEPANIAPATNSVIAPSTTQIAPTSTVKNGKNC